MHFLMERNLIFIKYRMFFVYLTKDYLIFQKIFHESFLKTLTQIDGYCNVTKWNFEKKNA